MDMPFYLSLEAISRNKQSTVIMKIEHAVSQCGAWITGHTPLAERYFQFIIETEPEKLGQLCEALQDTGMEFLGESRENLDLTIGKKLRVSEISLSLNLRFVEIPEEESRPAFFGS